MARTKPALRGRCALIEGRWSFLGEWGTVKTVNKEINHSRKKVLRGWAVNLLVDKWKELEKKSFMTECNFYIRAILVCCSGNVARLWRVDEFDIWSVFWWFIHAEIALWVLMELSISTLQRPLTWSVLIGRKFCQWNNQYRNSLLWLNLLQEYFLTAIQICPFTAFLRKNTRQTHNSSWTTVGKQLNRRQKYSII